MYVPIALRLVDDFTGSAPFATIGAALDLQDGADWAATGIEAVCAASGIIAYPGLGRVKDPATAPTLRYRVRLTDDNGRLIYRPAYRFSLDGLEFDVSPWNDSQPPAAVPDQPETVFLWPGTKYPFAREIPVLRGRTIDGGGSPLADARVETGTERVLSDERGAFSLPIRLTAPAASIMVVAEHVRTGLSASANIPLPAGLANAIELQLV